MNPSKSKRKKQTLAWGVKWKVDESLHPTADDRDRIKYRFSGAILDGIAKVVRVRLTEVRGKKK